MYNKISLFDFKIFLDFVNEQNYLLNNKKINKIKIFDFLSVLTFSQMIYLESQNKTLLN